MAKIKPSEVTYHLTDESDWVIAMGICPAAHIESTLKAQHQMNPIGHGVYTRNGEVFYLCVKCQCPVKTPLAKPDAVKPPVKENSYE